MKAVEELNLSVSLSLTLSLSLVIDVNSFLQLSDTITSPSNTYNMSDLMSFINASTAANFEEPVTTSDSHLISIIREGFYCASALTEIIKRQLTIHISRFEAKSSAPGVGHHDTLTMTISFPPAGTGPLIADRANTGYEQWESRHKNRLLNTDADLKVLVSDVVSTIYADYQLITGAIPELIEDTGSSKDTEKPVPMTKAERRREKNGKILSHGFWTAACGRDIQPRTTVVQSQWLLHVWSNQSPASGRPTSRMQHAGRDRHSEVRRSRMTNQTHSQRLARGDTASQ